MRRLALLAAAAVAVATSFAFAAPASATDCSRDPRHCSGSCHLNPDFTGPGDLIVCYN